MYIYTYIYININKYTIINLLFFVCLVEKILIYIHI